MGGITEVFCQGRPLLFSLKRQEALKADFERVALLHLSRIYTAAYYLTKNEMEAEDLVQETYLRALRSFHRFQPGTNCKAWLLTILRHLFINRYWQKRGEPETVDWEKIDHAYESIVEQGRNAESGNPEALFLSRLMDHEVEQALKALPEEYRTAVVLVDVQELTYEEAAKVMACAVGTIRSRLSRGRRMLQVSLRDYALEKGLIKGS